MRTSLLEKRCLLCSAGQQHSPHSKLVPAAEAYPAQSKTFPRPGPAHGFPQNLKSQFVGRSLASGLLKKKKKKKRPVMGSPRAELVLWELLLRCTALTSFHGNAQKQEQHGHTSTCQSCCLPGGSGPMSTETRTKLETCSKTTAPPGRLPVSQPRNGTGSPRACTQTGETWAEQQ